MHVNQPFPDSRTSRSSYLSWLMNVVLRLPKEERATLKVDGLQGLGFTDDRRAAYGNQDRIAIAYSVGDSLRESWLLAVVCDGVGGSSEGERAASITIATMVANVASQGQFVDPKSGLRESFLAAHEAAIEAFRGKSSTTVVALLVRGERAAYGWIGDSRLYELTERSAILRTEDDTLASATAKFHPELEIELAEEYGERLAQAIGGSTPVRPNVFQVEADSYFSPYLLCTDGVWKPTEKVLDDLLSTQSANNEFMRRLLLTSDWLGGVDNASAILVPSLEDVIAFFHRAENTAPLGTIILCLPGNQHTLLDPHGAFRKTRFEERQLQNSPPSSPVPSSVKPQASVEQDLVREEAKVASTSKPKTKSASKNKKKSEPKRPSNQMVIEEVPLDEASSSATESLPGDRSTN